MICSGIILTNILGVVKIQEGSPVLNQPVSWKDIGVLDELYG